MSVWCTLHSVSNTHRYFGNRERVCPIYLELFPIWPFSTAKLQYISNMPVSHGNITIKAEENPLYSPTPTEFTDKVNKKTLSVETFAAF